MLELLDVGIAGSAVLGDIKMVVEGVVAGAATSDELLSGADGDDQPIVTGAHEDCCRTANIGEINRGIVVAGAGVKRGVVANRQVICEPRVVAGAEAREQVVM